ncbi:MAG: YceI family protein [Candidatus Dormibacterales bacterium]
MNLPSGQFEIGPQNGRLAVHTHRQGLGARAGHDLLLEATAWKGTLEVEPAEGPRGRLDVRVDARSLEVREGTGGVKPLSEKDRRDIKGNLEEKVLRAGPHPEIRFQSDAVESFSEAGDSATATLQGTLEMNGRSQPATLEVTLAPAGGGLLVRGRATVQQTLWDIKPYTALLGALRVADEVEVTFDLEVPARTG